MSDPSVDLEKGITGLKEDKGITGLKEEEKAAHQLKVMCVARLLDVCAVLFFGLVMFAALSYYRQNHIWWTPLVLLSCTIFTFWMCHRKKHAYIRANTLASADSDLSTTLLASSSKK